MPISTDFKRFRNRLLSICSDVNNLFRLISKAMTMDFDRFRKRIRYRFRQSSNVYKRFQMISWITTDFDSDFDCENYFNQRRMWLWQIANDSKWFHTILLISNDLENDVVDQFRNRFQPMLIDFATGVCHFRNRCQTTSDDVERFRKQFQTVSKAT